jgi:acetylornithine deacetylase/succinyl-diaminopimelate desuccinylase-like protein
MEDKVLDEVLTNVDTDLAIELSQELVRIPSVMGDEKEIGLCLYDKFHELGFSNVELQEIYPDRYNVIGVVEGSEPGPTFVLTGHIDNKPVCEGWEGDPFSGDIKGGSLYGHGVMDMKAGVAGQVAAAYALKKSGLPLRGRVYIAAVCDHMGTQKGSIDFFERVKADMCILGELTDLQICIAHRGRYYFDISTIGKATHTCHKYSAVNAIVKMLPIIEKIEALRYGPEIGDEMKDLVGEELYMAVGRIYAGLPPGGPSMIPDRCTIRVDTRPQPGVSLEEVRGVLEEVIEAAKREDPELVVDMEVADIKNYWMVSPQAPIVRHIAKAFEVVNGEEPRFWGGSWLADTSSFGQDVQTVIFGPGREPVYMPNESLELTDIEIATKIYALTTAGALLDAEAG